MTASVDGAINLDGPGGFTSDPALEARGLSAGYSKQAVIYDVNLVVHPGEVVALLGPNGAGKTTTLLTLAGELPPLGGEVRIAGAVTTAPLHIRARNGLTFVTEEKSVFMGMSTRDNLRVAKVDTADALALFPELGRRLDVRGGLLSGGEQQMLTLARALGRKPACCWPTSCPWGWPPSSCSGYWRRCARRPESRAPRCSWSNNTCVKPWSTPIGPT